MRRSTLCIGLALALLGAGQAIAQHEGDIYLGPEGGEIVTGVWDGNDEPNLDVRVHAGTFGDSGSPGFTDDPGFDAPPGTFDSSFRIGFNVLQAIQVWNAGAFEATGGETFTIRFFTAEVTTGAGYTAGFDLAVQSNGGWHKHLSFFVNPAEGETDADPGVYLLELEMYSTDPTRASSKPFWIVFNHESPVEDWLEAIAWAEQHLVESPCPSDLDGDGDVGFADLLDLLAAWGTCPDPPAQCAPDVTGDGDVGFDDLLQLLANWGPCS